MTAGQLVRPAGTQLVLFAGHSSGFIVPMEIGVLGGKGTAGRAVVAELERRGHAVRVLSRRTGFDAAAPASAEQKLRGLHAIVDCLQPSKTDGRSSRALLVDGVGATLQVAAAMGVGHYVCLSIVGIDHFAIPYYRAKLDQERTVLEGPVPGSIVRATQFPELFDGLWNATRRLGVIPAPRGAVAPILPSQVAVALADTIEDGPDGARMHQVRGDAVMDLRVVAREWKRDHGSRRPVLPIPAVGATMRAIAAGRLVDDAARTVADRYRA